MSGRREAVRGQVLVLAAVGMLAVILLLALLFDGAVALLNRRTMQDAVDAAAMAGANQLGARGCEPDGTTSELVVTAVEDSLNQNGFPQALMRTDAAGRPKPWAEISCPRDERFFGAAVRVVLHTPGSRLVIAAIPVTVEATAMNGGLFDVAASILTLATRDCPSLAIDGSGTIVVEGSVHVNSSASTAECPKAALYANADKATIRMANGLPITVNGDYYPKDKVFSVDSSGKRLDPLTGMGELADPFEGHIDPPSDSIFGFTGHASWPAGWSHPGGSKSYVMQLAPGHYYAGDAPKNLLNKGELSVANGSYYLVLLPGVYIFDGVSINNNGTICTLPVSAAGTYTNTEIEAACPSSAGAGPQGWLTRCKVGYQALGQCGSLLFFTNPPALSVFYGGSGNLLLNPYFAPPQSTRTRYNGFLIWVSKELTPAGKYSLTLQGGGTSQITGTVYAPTTTVTMGGNPYVEGGFKAEATMQFIVWDLFLNGSSGFTLRYSAGSLARFTGYGLVD